MSLISWAKGVIQRLIGKAEIEAALKVNTAASSEMTEAISLWSAMYADCPPWKSETVSTFNLPATISSKFAKMVTLEAECTLTGSPRAEWLSQQLKPVQCNLRRSVELAAAKGGLVFKPFIQNGGIVVDAVQADRFFPTSFDSNGSITGGIFLAQTIVGRDIYTRLEWHEFVKNRYRVTNQVYKSSHAGTLGKLVPLSEVPDWAEIQPETWINGLAHPLFSYFKMPQANNVDNSSPLGASVFSRAVNTIEQVDRQYSRFLWEFEGGELAVHASADMFKAKPESERGEVELPEGKKRLYRALDGTIEPGRNLFETYAPAFRDQSLLNGFNALLRLVEQQSGLAYGTISNPMEVDKTATEIISSKQESYSTVSDIQNSLENALLSLVESMDALATAGNLCPRGNYKIAFTWDDSIIVDKEAERQRFWNYVAAGKFPFWKYLVEFEGYTDDEAKAIQGEMSQELGDPYAEPGIS